MKSAYPIDFLPFKGGFLQDKEYLLDNNNVGTDLIADFRKNLIIVYSKEGDLLSSREYQET